MLGYGCMRFTKKGGSVDLDKAEREVMAAIRAGVNYLDTAYVYAGNEAAVGEILARNGCREKIYLATKLPHYLIRSVDGAERMFQEELKRLRTDYIDYYLMHMLNDVTTWETLKSLGIEEWIEKKLASGQIRNIGFSYHGNSEMFLRLVDAYDWDFCQIQYNYLDEHSQAGVEGLRYAASKGLPVIIMEPLRGGRLVDLLPESAKALFAASGEKGRAGAAVQDVPAGMTPARQEGQTDEDMTPAKLAFRWLYSQPEVTCVLSGMNSMQMVEENIRTACESEPGCMTVVEMRLVERVKEEIARHVKVGCTGCGYCVPCPKGVDIPGTFRCYNAMYSEGKRSGRRDYLQCTAFRKDTASASQCVGCGKCESHCPQQIEIRKELKQAAAELETVGYKSVKKLIRLFRLW